LVNQFKSSEISTIVAEQDEMAFLA